MKRTALWLGALAWLLTMAVANGQSIFFDNFQEFPNGTDLTETNYVPGAWIPPGAYASTGTNTTTGISATTSNLLGNERLFITAPAGGFEYHASLYIPGTNLTAAVTNQVVSIKWLSWIAATKSLTATGGLGVAVSTNAYYDLQAHYMVVVFVDSGSIYAFTNQSNGTGSWPAVQIGSWSPYVGQIMTNNLTLNYPARTFSYSLNGTMLTNNMPLPTWLTNILTDVKFTCFESFPSSAGNKFALDDIALTVFTPTITAFQVVGGTNAIVKFTTLLGTSYDVERNDQIGVQAWTNFVKNVPGTGGIVQTNDTFSASLQMRFYRVRLLP